MGMDDDCVHNSWPRPRGFNLLILINHILSYPRHRKDRSNQNRIGILVLRRYNGSKPRERTGWAGRLLSLWVRTTLRENHEITKVPLVSFYSNCIQEYRYIQKSCIYRFGIWRPQIRRDSRIYILEAKPKGRLCISRDCTASRHKDGRLKGEKGLDFVVVVVVIIIIIIIIISYRQ